MHTGPAFTELPCHNKTTAVSMRIKRMKMIENAPICSWGKAGKEGMLICGAEGSCSEGPERTPAATVAKARPKASRHVCVAVLLKLN